ncbi:MAG TPA: ABC transporter ATP-binding protein [Acidobacteriaceae bacterium]|nr:ABC transporter ATP-binding protein [Acidobacteriaceae bacterium]
MQSTGRSSQGAGHTLAADLTVKRSESKLKPKPELKKVLPDVWKLIVPRKLLIAGSFVLLVMNRLCSFALPISAKSLINNVMVGHDMHLLPKIIGAVAVATLVQSITSYWLTQLLSTEGHRLISQLRMQVQAHIGRLPVSFYDENRAGTLVARIMTDVEGVRNLVGPGLVDFVGGILTALIAFFLMIHLNARMTLLTVFIVAVFGLILQRAFKTIRPIFREIARINAEVTGRLTESLGGVRVVKAYHAEASEARVFATGVTRLLNKVISSLTAQSLMTLSSTLMLGVVGGLIMYVGACENAAHRLDAGGYVTFTMLLTFMVGPLSQLVAVGTQLTEALVGLDRTREILNERQEDSESARSHAIEVRGHVAFEDVVFEYEKGKPVLHGIGFESPPGTVTALVGSSGSGKSTIISLICGFHTATLGQILIDGMDLATIKLSSYREQLGVVLQETFLFDGTIRENVLFSRPAASAAQWMDACRIARVDEFAEKFPEAYETVVGERGVKLSGGQRQRISIARAILADPRILILDEATSSLDSESEAMIQGGLNHLMQGRTTFVIAHRLSTIRRANLILVVEGGLIVESGTHETLYRAEGRYFDLYTRQHGLETNLFLAPGEGDKVAKEEPTF